VLCEDAPEGKEYLLNEKLLPDPPPPKAKPIDQPNKRMQQSMLQCINGEFSKKNNLRAGRSRLEVALRLWAKNWVPDQKIINPTMAHILAGQYATETLSLDSLNYYDYHTVSKSQEACRATGFYLCLAAVTRHEGGPSHIVEVNGSTLHGFVDLDGSKPFGSIRLNWFGEYNILDEDAWPEEPDSEEWGDPRYADNDDFVSRR